MAHFERSPNGPITLPLGILYHQYESDFHDCSVILKRLKRAFARHKNHRNPINVRNVPHSSAEKYENKSEVRKKSGWCKKNDGTFLKWVLASGHCRKTSKTLRAIVTKIPKRCGPLPRNFQNVACIFNDFFGRCYEIFTDVSRRRGYLHSY